MSLVSETKRSVYSWFTATNRRSWMSHLAIAVVVSAPPAGLFAWLFGSWLLFVVLGNIFAELTATVFASREVANFISHKTKGDDMEGAIWDGLGDLVGPYSVRIGWGVALLWWLVIR